MSLSKTLPRKIALFAAAAMLLAVLGGSPSASEMRRRVLILNSYSVEDSWTNEAIQGVVALFKERGADVEFLIEDIDMASQLSSSSLPEYRALLQDRYAETPPDLVITTGNDALSFVLDPNTTPLPKVPVVFCSLTDTALLSRFPNERATGVLCEDSALFILREILRLHGNASRINLIIDGTPRGLSDLERINRAATSLSYPGKMISASIGLDMSEIVNSLEKLSPESIILLGHCSVSSTGVMIPLPTLVEVIQSSCDLPTYSLLEETAALGFLGSVSERGFQRGYQAGEIALKVLGGTHVETVLPVEGESSRLVFNYAGMKELGIKQSSLPSHIVLFGDPFDELDQFVPYLAWNAVLLLLLGGSAIYLRRKIGARKIAESNLLRQNGYWESLFESSAQGIIVYDLLGHAKETNSRFRELFRIPEGTPVPDILSLLSSTGTECTEEDIFPRTVRGRWCTTTPRETRLPDGEGGTVPVSFLAFPLPSSSEGDIYCALFEDIGERKKLQVMLQRRTELQRQVTAISSRFVISREFDDTMERALEDMLALSGARFASLFVLSDTGTLVPKVEVFSPEEVKDDRSPGSLAIGEDFFWKSLLDSDRPPTVLVVESPSGGHGTSGRDLFGGREVNSVTILPLLLTGSLQGFLALADPLPHWSDASDEPMLGLFSELLAIAVERRKEEDVLRRAHDSVHSRFSGVISVLRQVSELRDVSTAGHQKNVSILANSLAVELQLPEDNQMAVRYAAMVHDLGKLYIPAEILSKPSVLSDAEYELVKKHPEFGHNILSPLDFPWPLAKIVLQHHERIDGTGYPYGIPGEEICLEARIIAVADAFEAMTSDRPYRKKKSVEAALGELVELAGTAYDPEIVSVFVSMINRQPLG